MYSTFFGECGSLQKRLYLSQWGFKVGITKNKVGITNIKVGITKNKVGNTNIIVYILKPNNRGEMASKPFRT